jgi:hypothetical protein
MDSNTATKTSQDEREQKVFDFYEENLPKKPYATDFLGALHILPKAKALEKTYIQHNNVYTVSWLVMDVDREDSLLDVYDRKFPAPNLSVTNKDNGHSHLFYGLENKVYRYNAENQKPIRYAAKIENALTNITEADENYIGFISKNPRHDRWLTIIWRDSLWSLDELADNIDFEKLTKKQSKERIIGLGRNCTLFDIIRKIAYGMVRDRVNYPTYDTFHSAIRDLAVKRNAEMFATPLMIYEVRGLAKSVAKWTWNHMSELGFLQWADARREKSISVRQQKSQELQNKIYELKKDKWDLSTRDIAERLGISKTTVARLIQKIRENKNDKQNELFI